MNTMIIYLHIFDIDNNDDNNEYIVIHIRCGYVESALLSASALSRSLPVPYDLCI